ncbi:MAG: alpha/beta fold hydrolase [Chloroflexota bacterium]
MLTRPVILRADGLKLSGCLYLPDGPAPYPTVCVCHGIPARIYDPATESGYTVLAERLCQEGLAVLLFNFRGAGKSEGNIDLLGWTRDLKAALNYLYALPEVDRSRLVLLGFSGGAAVSIYVASEDKRVACVASCASPAEFNIFAGPESLIARFRSLGLIRDKDFPASVEEWFGNFGKVSPIERVAGIAPRPLLLIHGSNDEVVNVSHAHRLYEKAGEPKQLVIIDGGGHRLREDETAMSVVIDWLKTTLLV